MREPRMIGSVRDVITLVEKAIPLCREKGLGELAGGLEQVLQLGSSPLEILGAVRQIFVTNEIVLNELLGGKVVRDVVEFVDGAFGGD